MIILQNGNKVADVDLAAQTIETSLASLEDLFYEVVDEGIPVKVGGEDEQGNMWDGIEIIQLTPENVHVFANFLADYGYDLER